jgi:transcriptional regulator with XRE-family HTH domain
LSQMQARMIAKPENAKSRSELAAFLASLRRRVNPDVRELGPHPRLASRVGKRVTQGELAEAIGASREWYTRLETAAAIRTSPALLNRLANALMVSPEERARLFHLAVPEVRCVRLRDDSIAVLEAFSRLRSLTNRLYTATSVEDVLATASEQIAEWFNDALIVRSTRRRQSGVWESRFVDDKQDRSKAANVIRELEDHLFRKTGSLDASHLYPRLANAGDLATPDLYPLPLQREILKVYARRRLPPYAALGVRVRSRTALIASLSTRHQFGHSYSASDCAALSAFAELASFALS